jgi:hypothetical protein
MVRKESSIGPAGFNVTAVTISLQLCCPQPLFKEARGGEEIGYEVLTVLSVAEGYRLV